MSSRKRHCFDVGSIAHNGSRLGEVGDLEAQSLNFSTNFK